MISKFSDRVEILIGDVLARLREMPDDSVDCVTTSPPYWGLRSYLPDGHDDKAKEIGLEPTLGEHLDAMVEVFREIRRVLKPKGVCFINYGDCYATAPNGRSAADTKALTDDDRTFRDKPFSTVGAIYDPSGGAPGGGARGKNKGNDGRATAGRVVAVFDPNHRPSTSKQRNREHGTAAKGGQIIGAYSPNHGKRGGVSRGEFTSSDRSSRIDHGGRVVSAGYLKPKDLCMVPQRLFIALQDDGWWVRSIMPWVKRNAMPESISDRPATALEYVAMLTKSERYFWDAEVVRKAASSDTHARIARNATAAGSTRANGGSRADRPMKAVGRQKVPSGWDTAPGHHGAEKRQPGVTPKSAPHVSGNGMGRVRANESFHAAMSEIDSGSRNFRNTDLFYSSIAEPWGLITGPDGVPLAIDANPAGFSEAHFATFPPALIEPLIKAGCPVGGRVLDPFGGAGTTGLVAASLGRLATLIELNPEYAALARARIEAAFMGREEGQRHMVKQLGKLELGAGPLFDAMG